MPPHPSSPYPLLEYLVAIAVELRENAVGCADLLRRVMVVSMTVS
jgi:hypothetical protein